MSERHDCTGDSGIIWINQNIPDKRLINFELIERHSFEIGQRRVAGPEVIQRKTNTLALQGKHFFDGVSDVGNQQAFSQFQLESMRVCSRLHENSQYIVDKTRLAKL